jgi:hypothetical protein
VTGRQRVELGDLVARARLAAEEEARRQHEAAAPRRCSKCRQELPREAFAIKNRGRLRSWCKRCEVLRVIEYRRRGRALA